MRQLSAVLVVALVAAGLAGCGGDESGEPLDKAEYVTRVRAIEFGADAQAASRLYFELVVGLPGEACADAARRFTTALHRIVEDVEELEPPSDAAALQAEFLVAAEESVTVVDEAVAEIEAGTLDCGSDLNRRVYGLPSTERAQAAISGLVAKGYAIGPGD